MKAILIVVVAPVLVVLLAGGAMSSSDATTSGLTGQGIDIEAVPDAARPWLGTLDAERADACPQLPLVWLVAEVQAESGWDPRAYSPAGAAGLLQLMPATWASAGGATGWDSAAAPAADHPVWDPPQHLAVAIPWMCGNFREMTAHLAASGKATSPLDALAVCHIAGCSRVTGSANGVPSAGEAGCDTTCAKSVRAYLAAIHGYVEDYSAPAPGGIPASGTAVAFTGASSGCTVPDPTGTGGCVTAATAWMLTQVQAAFGHLPTSCWDAHAWNPTSDHPQGKGCDLTFGALGRFPDAADTTRGWQVAEWLAANASPLKVAYVIWQGRIWSASRADEGWRIYTGGGVYDPQDATGGHYDHVHVSVAQ